MITPSTQLVWFRSDLRITDNTALLHAAAAGPAVGLFVLSPKDWERHDDAPVKLSLILRTLVALSSDLDRLGIPLLIRTADDPAAVPAVVVAAAKDVRATAVLWNDEYPLNEQRRDAATAAALRAANIAARTFTDQVIIQPGSVLTGAGTPYTVFTPFKKAWIQKLSELDWRPRTAPKPQSPVPGLRSDPIPDPASLPERFRSAVPDSLWPAGEAEATRRLTAFTSGPIQRYADQRDFPAAAGTSAISPYLTIGAISPRQCLQACLASNGGAIDSASRGPATWASELIWREFYKHVIHAFPRVSMGRAFKPATDRIRWADNPAHLAAWRDGQTGYPIVDAAQRQLLATGWMHNRLRMVSAMFYSKDLFLNWRLGEQHFMRHLVDGDFAANNGGWQWSSSTGTDAAPYFRIFNPESQSRRFDAEGHFIRMWVPELRDLDSESIHDPPPLVRARLGYPAPIVDHSKSAARVKAAFAAVKA